MAVRCGVGSHIDSPSDRNGDINMNAADIIIAAVVILVIAGAVFLAARRKKNGKSCSCGCSECGMCEGKKKDEKYN